MAISKDLQTTVSHTINLILPALGGESTVTPSPITLAYILGTVPYGNRGVPLTCYLILDRLLPFSILSIPKKVTFLECPSITMLSSHRHCFEKKEKITKPSFLLLK